MISKKRLLEDDLKAILIQHLKEKEAICRENSVIINELTIDNFSGRVDLVTADNKGLYAYEIKSEADSLSRLENQVNKYLQFFDKVVVFSAPKHIKNILKIVPKTVAVWTIENKKIKVIQRGKKQINQKTYDLLKLMKASDLRELVSSIGKTPEMIRRSVLEALLYDVPRAKIRAAVLKSLKNRYYKSSNNFWKNIDESVQAGNIVELSPYITERKRIHKLEIEQEEFWLRWSQNANKLPDDPLLLNLFKSNNRMLFGDVPGNIKTLLVN